MTSLSMQLLLNTEVETRIKINICHIKLLCVFNFLQVSAYIADLRLLSSLPTYSFYACLYNDSDRRQSTTYVWVSFKEIHRA